MDNTTHGPGGLGSALTLYGFAALILVGIVASYLLAGLTGLVICTIALTALVIVLMAVSARG